MAVPTTMCALISLLANWLNFLMFIRTKDAGGLVSMWSASADQRSQFSHPFRMCASMRALSLLLSQSWHFHQYFPNNILKLSRFSKQYNLLNNLDASSCAPPGVFKFKVVISTVLLLCGWDSVASLCLSSDSPRMLLKNPSFRVCNFTARGWVRVQRMVPDHTGANDCLWVLWRRSCVCFGVLRPQSQGNTTVGYILEHFNQKHTYSLLSDYHNTL